MSTLKKHYLSDYKSPNFLIPTINLTFDLHETSTKVQAQFELQRNPLSSDPSSDLVLDGRYLDLISITRDGCLLSCSDYYVDSEQLIIPAIGDRVHLSVCTQINPKTNTRLSGLYLSRGILTTQCEAEGFRCITYFLDRPDVLSCYSTRLIADKQRYPVLLSNGNLIERRDLDQGRHCVHWQDPFKKPSYLFALVAGDLDCLADQLLQSQRSVQLYIFSERGRREQCHYAMDALKQAMIWDEKTYGRIYDLACYHMVVIADFNMGAMENKGLAIFNEQCILADPQIATDADYESVSSVVAHEYFHNWTGNRITCRDWFQLSLKEGLTVFREQEFMTDTYASIVPRIAQVKRLRSAQFSEDAGPLAHPVQPQSYIEINNFYTLTVYEKGAELVRMLKLLLGLDKFHRGMDYYFSKYDGQAVTVEDFIVSFEKANTVDLKQFRLWYQQAGTPLLTVDYQYDPIRAVFLLTLQQSYTPTLDRVDKKPLPIPIKIGLLNEKGEALTLHLAHAMPAMESVLELTKQTQTFEFLHLTERPIPSLLRGFSAPVKLSIQYDSADLILLARYDSDDFNRWEASQRFAVTLLLEQVVSGQLSPQYDRLIALYRDLLMDQRTDKGLIAELISLPSEAYLSEQMACIDVDGIAMTLQVWLNLIAERLSDELLQQYLALKPTEPYQHSAIASAGRRLRGICLHYLMQLKEIQRQQLGVQQYWEADNMTDRLAALMALVQNVHPAANVFLDDFYQRAQGHSLIIDKWFRVQTCAKHPDVLRSVQALVQHPDYDIKNPNRVRAVLASFCCQNPQYFHRLDGASYQFLTEQILLIDQINPQLAAQLLLPLTRWKRYDATRSKLMQIQLQNLLTQALSKDLFERVSKSLQ